MDYYYKYTRPTNDFILKDMGKHYEMSRINKVDFNEFHIMVAPGIKVIQYEVPTTSRLISYEPTPEEIEAFNQPYYHLTLEKMKEVALMHLNTVPHFFSRTLMGWGDYDDKTKDPNSYSNDFIYPDGNTYDVGFSKGIMKIFPANKNIQRGRVPLVEFKFNLNQWAEKYHQKLDTLITEVPYYNHPYIISSNSSVLGMDTILRICKDKGREYSHHEVIHGERDEHSRTVYTKIFFK